MHVKIENHGSSFTNVSPTPNFGRELIIRGPNDFRYSQVVIMKNTRYLLANLNIYRLLSFVIRDTCNNSMHNSSISFVNIIGLTHSNVDT